MRGLDYKWIEALDAIVEQRSFDKAAEHLYISQSAVSQRVKQLEKWLAQPVLVREQPPRPTAVGKKLLGLYRRVRLLEQELVPELAADLGDKPLSVSLATNADSLATWLLPSLFPLLEAKRVELNLIVDDEGRTIEKLKNGEVVGAISLESQSIPGCVADYLGRVDYLCVASPSFIKRYFSQGVNRESLIKAPAVAFDQHDKMHQRFVNQHFNIMPGSILKHTVRSSEAFVKLAVAGVAYCLIPKLQIQDELASGALIELTPNILLSHQIYWHHWQLESGVLGEVSDAIISHARQYLPQ
ncbi:MULTISPECIES: LysR family transcriptional regulator ArgP [Vibrio]|jgi:LysR family transcriptional regulator (chromosome initiation inhibitor)|uniref:HTH-type transcriptional regulator ArgP n=2 Tax=Vibrio TaxID=662 RepID=A0A2C9PCJ7_9VIBR|nr:MULTISPECIES: LysR family transcriptional regulator ArgP [Vibrio]ASI89817.1 transcriptional regulator ArgP [Vibrio mediterranei]AYV21773.1 LysR family transcriptional regulator ArgP [Vibrio mediterranei]EDL50793.1 chromosome replication initiation inhibitor protein [Vibrio mediterranei AK1]KFA96187.1 chromosome replication initiation inhibitor protein [Vibrio sp. ER1A]MCF4172011.1 LysR family transcriptional regulator ArgP [Vibrio sp. McD22-P3]